MGISLHVLFCDSTQPKRQKRATSGRKVPEAIIQLGSVSAKWVGHAPFAQVQYFYKPNPILN